MNKLCGMAWCGFCYKWVSDYGNHIVSHGYGRDASFSEQQEDEQD